MRTGLFIFLFVTAFRKGSSSLGKVAVLSIDGKPHLESKETNTTKEDDHGLSYLSFTLLVNKDKDTSEFWRETEILSLVRNYEVNVDHERCEQAPPQNSNLRLIAARSVRPICKTRIDYQLCPQCSHLSNQTECLLFKDSCREREVLPMEYRTYCDVKYGRWRTMFLPADYTQCRCCDECIFYRELDQSCVEDEYNINADEFLPVTTIDFRAGCNPYLGHPEQEFKALRCDKTLRRCVPVATPEIPNVSLNIRKGFRYEPPQSGLDCPITCRGYQCPNGMVKERNCESGAFLPDRNLCNCCGRCSVYHQLGQKCAEFRKRVLDMNGTKEIEVEEEFMEPGCDDGMVCRHGRCQDIHSVMATERRRRRDDGSRTPYEPCKREQKLFKKKYGYLGHLHFEAPQCTSLWLYAPVQCRRFLCYCALEDGTRIEGIKVPRVEVYNMNCDCAREKCRTGFDVQCDGYGNYKDAIFTPHEDK